MNRTIILGICFLPNIALASLPRTYICYRTVGPVKIDGKLDDSSWKVPWTEFFVDIEGDRKQSPRFSTRAKMVWDDRYLYVGAQLQEPCVWGTLQKHDAIIYHDNDFEIFIDPEGDNRDYYEIELNALNAVFDLLLKKPYRDGGPALLDWDMKGLKTAVAVEGTLNDPKNIDSGWSIEAALPWDACARDSLPPRNGDQWRMNFSRVEWQLDASGGLGKMPGKEADNWVWSPQGAVNMHMPEKWGIVQFSTDPAGRALFTPDPSLPAREILFDIYYSERSRVADHRLWTSNLDSLGVKFSAKDYLTLPVIDLTPDGFSAWTDLQLAGGKRQRWHIRQDSYIWHD